MSQDPLVGTTIAGRYLLEGLVSTGGTGRVYRARQEPIGRPVALKLLRYELTGDQRELFEKNFFEEARQAATLQHPNVVTVHDYGRTESGECYLVMEFVEGLTLKELLRQGPPSHERILRIFDQIAQGLRHAHGRGLVHRDVKPSNIVIMRGDEGEDHVKILDFGLVRAMDDEITETSATPVLGTPHYMSPEQIQGGHTDQRADVYSLGVMLYTCLVGIHPFSAPNTAALLYLHIHEPFPSMANRAPSIEVPANLEAICRTCMEKDPSARFFDMDAFLAALRTAARLLPGAQSLLLQDVIIEDSPPWDENPLPDEPPPTTSSRPERGPAGHLWTHPLFWILVVGMIFGGIAVGLSARKLITSWVLSRLPFGVAEQQLLDEPASELEASAEAEPAETRPLQPASELVPPQQAPISNTPRAVVTPAPQRELTARDSPRTTTKTEQSDALLSLEGVSFDSGQSRATLAFANNADADALKAAGVYPQARRSIMENRPFRDMRALADAPFISTKTLEALRKGASRP